MHSTNEKILCVIYRSERRAGAYLYVPQQAGNSALDALPQALLQSLGELTEVMRLALHPGRKLAVADVATVMRELSQAGFYLQLPPGDARFKRENPVQMGAPLARDFE